MKTIGAAILYLFVAGIILGPWLDQKSRCGEDVSISEALVAAVAVPVALGAAITSGDLGPRKTCQKKDEAK